MVNPQYIQEYSALTTQQKWQELRSIFAIINDVGERLQLLEMIVEKNQLNKEDVKLSDVTEPAPAVTKRQGFGVIE